MLLISDSGVQWLNPNPLKQNCRKCDDRYSKFRYTLNNLYEVIYLSNLYYIIHINNFICLFTFTNSIPK